MPQVLYLCLQIKYCMGLTYKLVCPIWFISPCYRPAFIISINFFAKSDQGKIDMLSQHGCYTYTD